MSKLMNRYERRNHSIAFYVSSNEWILPAIPKKRKPKCICKQCQGSGIDNRQVIQNWYERICPACYGKGIFEWIK